MAVFDALHDAGEGFDEGGVAEGGFGLEAQEIFLHEAARDDDGFRVGTVEEEEVVAQVFLFDLAGGALAAGAGVGDDDAVADVPVFHVGRGLADDAGEFVAEDGGRDDHAGVVAALENFQVRAAGQRHLDGDADFAGAERWLGAFFNADVFFAMQDSGSHGGDSATSSLHRNGDFAHGLHGKKARK